MSNLKDTCTQPPAHFPASTSYTPLRKASRTPPASSDSSYTSLTSFPTESRSMSPGSDLGSLDNPIPNAVTAQTVNITTLNVTYGGDGYNGSIHNGYVGGRRNEYYSESRSYTAPPPPSFAVEGATLAFGLAGALGIAGIVMMLMLPRR